MLSSHKCPVTASENALRYLASITLEQPWLKEPPIIQHLLPITLLPLISIFQPLRCSYGSCAQEASGCSCYSCCPFPLECSSPNQQPSHGVSNFSSVSPLLQCHFSKHVVENYPEVTYTLLLSFIFFVAYITIWHFIFFLNFVLYPYLFVIYFPS
jgi:hypothetical protein